MPPSTGFCVLKEIKDTVANSTPVLFSSIILPLITPIFGLSPPLPCGLCAKLKLKLNTSKISNVFFII